MSKEVYLILNNVRSAYNVGAIFRLADAVNVSKLFLCGLTPYPKLPGDTRPAYVASQTDKMLRKTGLAGLAVPWEHCSSAVEVVTTLKTAGVTVVALEQTARSVNYLEHLRSLLADDTQKIGLVLGHEREGVEEAVLGLCQAVIEIPMRGQGHSLNVAQAAAVVLYARELLGLS